MKINENTNIGLPLRNLIGLIGAIVIGAWFAFGVIERLNKLETADILFKEIPDLWTWIGGIVVFSSVLIITYNERSKEEKKNKNIINAID